MIDERTRAVRKLRAEADNLRLACVAAARTSSILHVAYDQELVHALPRDQQILLGAAEAALSGAR